MPKNAYYFSHDSNAKDDPKCSMLIEQLGLEGYGIYWVLVETLRDQPEYRYPLSMISILARKYNTTTEKVRIVISGYDLFQIDSDEFFSLSLCRRMEKMDKQIQQRTEAGKASAERRRLMLVAPKNERPFNDRSTDAEQIKGNEKKIKLNKTKEEQYDYFSDFWSEYPKKEAKQEAMKVFATLKMNDELMEKVMDGLFRAIEQWKKNEFKFVPQAPRWLRGRRWEDGK